MKKLTFPSLLLAVVSSAALLAASHDGAQTPATAQEHADTTAQENAGTEVTPATGGPDVPSLVMAKDPATGRLKPATSEQLEELLTEDMRKALSTSSTDLFEEPSPTPGGGVMIDLQGRFRNAHWASRSEDGELSIQCESGMPEDREATSIEER